jgi:hypothetical protein
MENGNVSQGEGKDPSSFLSDIIGNSVTVKLNSGVVYKGEVFLSTDRSSCFQTPGETRGSNRHTQGSSSLSMAT